MDGWFRERRKEKIHFDINTAQLDGDVGTDMHILFFFKQTKIWKFLYLPWRGAEIKIRPCREFPPCQRRTGRPTGRREATCGAVSCPWWVRHSIDGAAEDSANWLKLSSRWPIAVASSTTRGASPSPDRELLTIGPRPIPKEPHSRKKENRQRADNSFPFLKQIKTKWTTDECHNRRKKEKWKTCSINKFIRSNQRDLFLRVDTQKQ